MTPHQIYDHLEARCLPMIEHYQTDLTKHDRRTIIDDAPGVPFLHATNPMGTHILVLHPFDHEYWPAMGERVRHLFGTIDRHGMLENVQQVAYYLTVPYREQRLYLYFDGHQIHEVSGGEFLQIAKNFVRDTVRAWLVDPIKREAA